MSETNINQNSWPTEQKRIDPGLDPVTNAHNNMKSLVEKVSHAALEQLTLLRDEIDTTMAAIHTRNDELLNAITQHAQFCTSAIKTKEIIADSMRAIQSDFNGNGQSILTVQNDKQ